MQATCPHCAFSGEVEVFFADDEGKRLAFVVADLEPECARAVHYAGRRAKNTNGALVLVYVIPEGDFQQWRGVLSPVTSRLPPQ